MRRIAHLGAVMATAIALVPALTPLQPAQVAAAVTAPSIQPRGLPASPADDDVKDVPLVVSEITPESVGEKSTVTVTGRVSNLTEETQTGVSVRLRYSSYPLSDRDALDAHADGEGSTLYQSGPRFAVDGDLPPGVSVPFTLKAKAKDLDLLGGLGVYPITIEALSDSAGAIDAQHTFLPYIADTKTGDLDTIKTAWVWPLMGRPQRADDDTYLGDGLNENLAADGRLGVLLSTGAQEGEIDPAETGEPVDPDAEETPESPSPSPAASPGQEPGDETPAEAETEEHSAGQVPVTWAVDPGLLADIERLSSSGYQSLTAGRDPAEQPALQDHDVSVNAQAWLTHARRWLDTDPLLASPYADADLPALLAADLDYDAERSVRLGQETVREVLGRDADPTLSWPAQSSMDSATRDFLAAGGTTTFILNDAALPAQRWLGYTPTAAVSLPVPDREAGTALVADSKLTAAMGADTHSPGAATLSRQRFAAETAMIAAERPSVDRTIVLAPPRDWDPSREYAEGLLEASDSLPWLDVVALNDVKVDNAGTKSRQKLTYPDKLASSRLSGDELDDVRATRRQVKLFNSVLADDEDPFRPAVLRMQSAWWREDEALAAVTRARVSETVETTKGKVHVIPGEPITLASKNGTLGVVLANDLETRPVKVYLSIFSENSERLAVGNYTDSMEIGPGGKTTVYVPLSAKVNGRTVLHMSLQNADGEPLAEEQTMTPVNVTGLGTGALIISGSAVLVLILALAPRALRKWMRNRARTEEASQGPAPEPAGGVGADAMPHNGNGPVRDESAAAASETAPDLSGRQEPDGSADTDRESETVGVDGDADGAPRP
nr:DUF6049 family protein [Nocardiopsis ansamitocini]